MTKPKILSSINTSDSVNPSSPPHASIFVSLSSDQRTLVNQSFNRVAGFDVFTPNQGTEDGILVSKVIIFNHGLSLERYINSTETQRKYLDNFVCSIIRDFCSLLDSYTKVH